MKRDSCGRFSAKKTADTNKPTDSRAGKRFDFGGALALLRGGLKVARAGWNGKGMFLYYVPGSKFAVNRAPLLGFYPDGTQIQYRPHIDMKAADGSCVPWIASQTDMLADDWQIVE